MAGRLFVQSKSRKCTATDLSIALDELNYFRSDGGNLIVDQSVLGLARDADGLADLPKLSGVHAVAAAGCYTEPYLPKSFMKKILKI